MNSVRRKLQTFQNQPTFIKAGEFQEKVITYYDLFPENFLCNLSHNLGFRLSTAINKKGECLINATVCRSTMLNANFHGFGSFNLKDIPQILFIRAVTNSHQKAVVDKRHITQCITLRSATCLSASGLPGGKNADSWC